MINGTSTTYTVSPTSNQLSGASGGMNVTYGYDPQGNTTTLNGATAYQYNSFGRLVNADGTGYEVSAEGQRLRKIGAGVSTYFAPDVSGALLAEQRNGMWIDYVWLNGRLLTILTPSGGIYPVHTDQTGRPMVLSTTVGQSVEWQAQNLPFDRKVTDTIWFDQNVGFPGQYYDAESGLYYNGNRDYDPTTGRYIESDPIGLAGGLNTYAYVGNNPISSVDPMGLEGYGSWTDPNSSRQNNPNLNRNMVIGGVVGAVGLVVFANVIGFPEVEAGEGMAAIWAGGATVGGIDGATAMTLMDAMAGEPMGAYFWFNFSAAANGFVPGAAVGFYLTQQMPPAKPKNCP